MTAFGFFARLACVAPPASWSTKKCFTLVSTRFQSSFLVVLQAQLGTQIKNAAPLAGKWRPFLTKNSGEGWETEIGRFQSARLYLSFPTRIYSINVVFFGSSRVTNPSTTISQKFRSYRKTIFVGKFFNHLPGTKNIRHLSLSI